jgi:hypothetical protein
MRARAATDVRSTFAPVTRWLLAVVCPAALATSLATSVAASPRADPTLGRAVFTGASSVHPTAVQVNPAALGVDSVVRIYLAGTSVVEHDRIVRAAEDENGERSPSIRLSDLRPALGSDLSASWHPTDRISVGVALRSAPAETFFSGNGARYFSAGGGQRDISASFAGTLRVSSLFYVGAALRLARANLTLRFDRDTASAAGSAGLDSDCGLDGVVERCGVGNPNATETYEIDVAPSTLFSNQNLALTLGILIRLGGETLLGVSYHTPPGFSVQSELVGSAKVTQAPRDGGATLTGDATVDVSYPASVDVGLTTPLATEWVLIAGLRWEDTSRLSGYDVRPYGGKPVEPNGTSTFNSNGIPEWIRRARGLNDAVALWAGVEQVDRGRWRLGGRVGFETATVDDNKIAPSNIANRSVTLDLGVQWRPSTAPWALQFTYGLGYFLPITVSSSVYSARNAISCVDGNFDYSSSACRAARNGFGIEAANGDYQRVQHAFRFGASYEF